MLRAGIFLGDRYEIIEKIGAGGMAEVFKGRDHKLNRDVAIKVLRQEFSEDTGFVSKFKVEAQSAAGLTDKNIISIYDVGEENGLYYIVMELVEGMTLKRFIEGKGRLEIKQVISIAMQISMGLETAHRNHIIHRDIKPQNVLLSGEGKVKITDFGIAKAATSNTVSSNVMGSVHYTSPEQARGGYSDEKSDIYSLGITMYEMLTGHPPFDGDSTVSIAVSHIQEKFPDIRKARPETPIALEKIILKCTMKKPECRYANMTELIADLKQCLLTPNEDFVKMVSYGDGNTRRMSKEEVGRIKQETARKNVTPENMGKAGGNSTPKKPQGNGSAPKKPEEDEELNPKLEKTLTILGIVAAAIVLAVAVFAVFSLVKSFGGGSGGRGNVQSEATPTPSVPEGKVKMISVLGKTKEEALAELNAMNLGLDEVGTENSNDYAKGQIMNQNIAEGETVDVNTTLEVIISKGPAALSMPDVKGKKEADARSEIEAMGLTFKVVDNVYSSDYALGQVTATNPEPGTEVNRGDVVEVTLSRGTEKVNVPNLYNKTQEDAVLTLAEAGLEVGTVDTASQYDDTVPAGNVLSQNYPAGTSVEKGTRVNLVLSKGPEEESHVWKGSVRIPKADLPAEFESGSIKLELTQTVDDATVTKTILDQTLSASDFPYTMQVIGASGVSNGSVVLYVNGERAGSYSVLFSEE